MSVSPRVLAIGPGDLLKALNQATQGFKGWAQAIGQLEDLELRVTDPRVETRRSLKGRYTLAALNGPFGGPYNAVVSRATTSGIETVGGQLVSARSIGVTAFLTILETDAQSATADAAADASWAAKVEAAAANQKSDVDDDDVDEEILPEAGDLVHHFAFGLCEVLQEKGDSLVLRDVEKPNRIREIKIDMLAVSRPSERDGKRFFQLTRKV